MMVPTALCVTLLCAGLCAAAQDAATPVVACNLKAISSHERPRYNDLMQRLRASVRNRREVRAGYSFNLNGNTIGLLEVVEWITIERRCCPFLTFQLSASGRRPDWVLKLTGPEGVKALLETEFPVR